MLLLGCCVLNEAMLTGESVPQRKEALGEDDDESGVLQADTTHRRHVLFGGTELLDATCVPEHAGEPGCPEPRAALRGVPVYPFLQDSREFLSLSRERSLSFENVSQALSEYFGQRRSGGSGDSATTDTPVHSLSLSLSLETLDTL